MRPARTLSWTIGAGLAAFVALGASGQGQVANDEEAQQQVAEERSRTMKTLGRSMRTLKGFVEGRGNGGGSGGGGGGHRGRGADPPLALPGRVRHGRAPRFRVQEVIWEDWEEFVAGTERLGEKAAALQAAISSGDSDRIGAAFGDLGKNGCGGCHSKFREKRDS